MAELITSIGVRPTGGPHAEVSLFINHAFTGALVMRTEEAEAFKTLPAQLQRARRLEALLAGWPEKLTVAADWLDLLDAALEALAKSQAGRLRQEWEEQGYGSYSMHDEIQQGLRALAVQLRGALAGESA